MYLSSCTQILRRLSRSILKRLMKVPNEDRNQISACFTLLLLLRYLQRFLWVFFSDLPA